LTSTLHRLPPHHNEIAATQNPPLPTRSYAEAATMTLPPHVPAAPPSMRQLNGQPKRPHHPDPYLRPPKNKDKGKERVAPSAAIPSTVAPPSPPQSQTDKKQQLRPKTQARAVVLHAAPTKYKPGQIRRWIKGDNQGKVRILGIRWLLQEPMRIGKLASLLVIYLGEKVNISQGIRIGRKIFRTREYDWGR